MGTIKLNISDVSEAHADIIIEALNLYSRILVGQVEVIHEFLSRHFDAKVSYEEIEHILKNLKKCFFSLPQYASYGICDSDETHVSQEAKTAYDMLCTIQYSLSWIKHPEGGMTVNFNHPLHTGKLPFISVKEDK